MKFTKDMSRTRTIGAKEILKLLAGGAFTTSEIIANAMLAPLRVSYRGIPGSLQNKRISFEELASGAKASFKERRKFYGLLNSLKRDDLIYQKKLRKKMAWILSANGMREMKKIRNEPRERYIKGPSNSVVIISYDIPENRRKDRGWLRSVLKLLDFKMLHQSVWLGKIKVPETLLTDLRERKLIDFVQIFSVDKRGSLEKII